MNTATEFANKDLLIADIITDSTDKISRVFFDAIVLAQSQGDIPGHKDPKILSQYLFSNLSGLHAMLKAGKDKKNLARNRQNNAFVTGLNTISQALFRGH